MVLFSIMYSIRIIHSLVQAVLPPHALMCLQSSNYRLEKGWGCIQLHIIHTKFLNMRPVGSKIWMDGQTNKHTHTHTHVHTWMCMHTAAAWWSHGPHGIHCPTLFSWDENYAENGITHFEHSFLLTSWSFPTTTIHSVILDNRKLIDI